MICYFHLNQVSLPCLGCEALIQVVSLSIIMFFKMDDMASQIISYSEVNLVDTFIIGDIRFDQHIAPISELLVINRTNQVNLWWRGITLAACS